jgi:hypothetical protein
MRLAALTLVTLAALAFQDHAAAEPPTRQVEVTNLPAASGPARFQLVGFTTATYTGNMGGHFGVTRKCQLEYPGSRMCSPEEVALTTTIPTGLVGQAWVHLAASGTSNQHPVLSDARAETHGGNCFGWLELSEHGPLVSSSGVVLASSACTEEFPIACCAPVP